MKIISILSILFFASIGDSSSYEKEIYIVDQFSKDLSLDWKGRNENFDEVYYISKEDGNPYLKARSEHSDNLIIKKIEVDIVKYPYLNWKWRVHKLPTNGNESVKKHCDVSASIALVLNKSRFFPKSIKYSWSTTLDQNIRTKSPFAIWPSRCDIHVVESGEAQIGKWVAEKINVLEDYKRFYGKRKVVSKKIHAIVIMSDSDNTMSLSEADYDDIYFSKR